jgi:hypothetical protein
VGAGDFVQLRPAPRVLQFYRAVALDPPDQTFDARNALEVRRAPDLRRAAFELGGSRAGRSCFKWTEPALEGCLAQLTGHGARPNPRAVGGDQDESIASTLHAQSVFGSGFVKLSPALRELQAFSAPALQ